MSNSIRISKLKPADISLFCSQISLFLRSGVTLVEGLDLMSEDAGSERLLIAVKQIGEEVRDQKSFTEALESVGCFPDYLVNMVRIGEKSGSLDEIMASLSRNYEREDQLKQRVRSAVTYPITLIIMMAAVVLLMIVMVLPIFEDILTSLGGEMPPFVSGIMGFGRFLSQWGWLVLLIIVAIIVFIKLWKRTPSGRGAADTFKANFPIFRGINRKIAAERFASAMGFLLHSGMDIETSLDMTAQITDNRFIAGRIDICRRKLSEGASFSDAVLAAGIFPRLFTRMLGIGQKTGNLDEMMTKLADIYESDVDNSLKRLTASIEPVFVAILSIIVGFILVSVMLPLINLMATIG